MTHELLNQALSQVPVSMAIPAWIISAIISGVMAMFNRGGGTSDTSGGDTGLSPEMEAQLKRLLQGQEQQIGNLDPLQQAVAQMAMKRLPTRYQQPMPWTPWGATAAGERSGLFGGGGTGPYGGVGGAGGGGAAGGGDGQKPTV